jgi:hypothetical protein
MCVPTASLLEGLPMMRLRDLMSMMILLEDLDLDQTRCDPHTVPLPITGGLSQYCRDNSHVYLIHVPEQENVSHP